VAAAGWMAGDKQTTSNLIEQASCNIQQSDSTRSDPILQPMTIMAPIFSSPRVAKGKGQRMTSTSLWTSKSAA